METLETERSAGASEQTALYINPGDTEHPEPQQLVD